MRLMLASSSGRASRPEQRSLESDVAKAAADRGDPVWHGVLEKLHSGPVPLAKLQAGRIALLFIAGGRRMLSDLRQADLGGASPTPFCRALKKLAIEVHDRGGVIGAVGHGSHGLPDAAELATAHDAAAPAPRNKKKTPRSPSSGKKKGKK